jgi:hypothetical protein
MSDIEIISETEDDIQSKDIDNQSQAEEQEQEQPQLPKEFVESVTKYVRLDDLIREREGEVKELKNSRKPYETTVLNYLKEHKESCVEITGGKLINNKSETVVPLKMDHIKEAVQEFVEDPAVVEKIMEKVKNRPKNTRYNLKRTRYWAKGGKKKA